GPVVPVVAALAEVDRRAGVGKALASPGRIGGQPPGVVLHLLPALRAQVALHATARRVRDVDGRDLRHLAGRGYVDVPVHRSLLVWVGGGWLEAYPADPGEHLPVPPLHVLDGPL